MVKFLRREAVRADPHYQKIVTEAVERLTEKGYFCKDEVLDSTQLSVFADVIRWDYIRDFIRDDHDVDLIPLASVYFKPRHREGSDDSRHGREHPPETFPERYIATGYGKKTAGWCIADQRNGHFVVKRLEQVRQKAMGSAKKANAMLERAKRKGVVGLENRRDLPMLTNGNG